MSINLILLPTFAFGIEQEFSSARPMGMAGAFVAIADDSNAFNWNPAGLPTIEHYEFNSLWYKEEKKGLKPGYLTFVTPIIDENRSLGFGWQDLKLPESDFTQKGVWGLSYGQKLKKWSLGGKLNCITYNQQDFSSSIEMHIDAGILYRHSEDLRIGLAKYGLLKANFQGAKLKNPVSYKIGLAYKLKGLLIGADIDNDGLHLGAEHWLSKTHEKVSLGLRSGVQLGKGKTHWSLGTSLKLKRKLLGFKSVQVDYAYVTSDTPTHYLCFSTPFDYLTSLLTIKDMEWNPMFRELYACTYQAFVQGKIAVGTLTVENKMANEAVKIKLNLDMGTYTNNQARPLWIEEEGNLLKEYDIPAKSTKKIQITRLLIEDNIMQTKQVPFSPKLEVSYTLHNQSYQKPPITTQANISGQRGTDTYRINWDWPEMISAFVTTEDNTLIARFTDQVAKWYQEVREIPAGNENLFKAMYVFEALKAYGLSYEGKTAPVDRLNRKDYIAYPDQILKMGTKTADCEEIAIIYASCLKRWGVPLSFLEAGPSKNKKHLLVIIAINQEEKDEKLINLNLNLNQMFITKKEWGTQTWLPIALQRQIVLSTSAASFLGLGIRDSGFGKEKGNPNSEPRIPNPQLHAPNLLTAVVVIEVSRIESTFIEACRSGMEFYKENNTEDTGAKNIPINDLFVYPLPPDDFEKVVFLEELREETNKLFQADIKRFTEK